MFLTWWRSDVDPEIWTGRRLDQGATLKMVIFGRPNFNRTCWSDMGMGHTYRYIFSGMNSHLPAILGFTRYQGFDPSPYRLNKNARKKKNKIWLVSKRSWSYPSGKIIVTSLWPHWNHVECMYRGIIPSLVSGEWNMIIYPDPCFFIVLVAPKSSSESSALEGLRTWATWCPLEMCFCSKGRVSTIYLFGGVL